MLQLSVVGGMIPKTKLPCDIKFVRNIPCAYYKGSNQGSTKNKNEYLKQN